jgi:prolyl-tRNA synthetase
MITRMSTLFLRTLRDDPADAEVASHRLLVRAGFIRREAPGVFAWLPLGLRVLRRIEHVVREEMVAAGSQEVHFPALLPREPYEATGRWTEYGPELFKLQDRKGADYLLAPTHEEVFTLLVKDLYASYKDLPVNLFQIQTKYRDELRPRAGLLRGREFVMKDAYSFDIDDAGLDVSYQAMRDAYERIFRRLGVEYAIVQANAGPMGGSRSEEFLSPSPIGEDSFVRSAGGYAANTEAVTTPLAAEAPIEGQPDPVVVPSPDAATIGTLVSLFNAEHPRADRPWTAADTLKNVVLALTDRDGRRSLVVVGLPGDREVDLDRAEIAFDPCAVEAATPEDFAAHPGLVKGYIGPWSADGPVLGEHSATGIPYLLDPRVARGSRWITGANQLEAHVASLVCGRDFEGDGVADVAEVRAGDPAPDGSGPLEMARGIEIGHVFQLGRKYADALDLQVLDEAGRLTTVTMGSYGIGITRVLAVIAQAHHDDRGLVWPRAVAPFDVHVVATGRGDEVFAVAERLAEQFRAVGAEVLLDDRRKVSAGVKFRDAELLGNPLSVIVGRGLATGVVELRDRATDARTEVPVDEAVERAQTAGLLG